MRLIHLVENSGVDFSEPEETITDPIEVERTNKKIEATQVQLGTLAARITSLVKKLNANKINVINSIHEPVAAGYFRLDSRPYQSYRKYYLWEAKDTPTNRVLAARLIKAFEEERTKKEIMLALQSKAKGLTFKVNFAGSSLKVPPERVVVVNGTNLTFTNGKAKVTFTNPYFVGPFNRFVGAPVHCPHWTKKMKEYFLKISELLETYKVPPLDLMYYSYAANHGQSYSNFAVINQDDSFIWKKYDRGGGSAMNLVFILHPNFSNATKCNTTDFSEGSKSFLTTLLHGIAKP